MGRCSHASHARTIAACFLLFIGVSLLVPYGTRAEDTDSSPPTPDASQDSTPSGSATITAPNPGIPGIDLGQLPSIAPTFLESQLYYPQLDANAVRGTFAPPYQTAFKDGDETYIVAVIHYATPITHLTADLSALGGDSAVEVPAALEGNFTTLFQGIPVTVNLHGANTTGIVTLTATDALGVSVRAQIPVRIDNSPPTATITSLAFSTTSPRENDTALVSGTIHDEGGSGVGVYGAEEVLLDANGASFHPWRYTGSGEDMALENLHEGNFQNTALLLREFQAGDLDQAHAFTLTMLIKDGAGHATTTSITVPLHATTTETTAPASNVLFLPGIEQSKIFDTEGCLGISHCDLKLWEPGPNFGRDIRAMMLDEHGKSVRGDIHVQDEGIIASVFGMGDFYGSFFAKLDALQQERTIMDWKAIPYDWRLSLDDIVQNGAQNGSWISYTTATDTPYIEQTLRTLAQTSHTGKVTIIAHSNGGLVAKALMQKIGDADASRLIDKVILVGVPQSGAPQSVATLLYGYGQGIPDDGCYDLPFFGSITGPLCNFMTSRSDARKFAENSPGAYGLLPSARYFSDVQDSGHPIISFSGAHVQLPEHLAYGSSIHSASTLYDFLLAREGGRLKPGVGNIESPNVLNPEMISYAKDVHDRLDAWTPPAGVSVYQIAGWGDSTISGIEFYEEPHLFGALPGYKLQYRPKFTESGDGTVPVPSALMLGKTSQASKYWINLLNLFKRTKFYGSHANLLAIPPVQRLLDSLLRNTGEEFPDFISESSPVSTSTDQLLFILHSPLTLELEDSNGNKLGLTTDGTSYRQIESGTFGQLGEVKYVLAPNGSYKLIMHGLDTGTFSLDVEQLSGDTITASTTFADIPTTAQTFATLSIDRSIASTSALTVDEDGNGTSDIMLSPRLDETVQYAPISTSTQGEGTTTVQKPTLPPVTTSSSGSSRPTQSSTYHSSTRSLGTPSVLGAATQKLYPDSFTHHVTKSSHQSAPSSSLPSRSPASQASRVISNSQTGVVFETASQHRVQGKFSVLLQQWIGAIVRFITHIL